mgnify:CR=1 FL=1
MASRPFASASIILTAEMEIPKNESDDDATSPLLESDSELSTTGSTVGSTVTTTLGATASSVISTASGATVPTASAAAIPKRSSKYSITSSENLSRPQSPQQSMWPSLHTARNGTAGIAASMASSHSTAAASAVQPLAIEPTDDGVASINTVFLQLPGGMQSPVRACLGSALVQTSRQYTLSTSIPNPHKQQQLPTRSISQQGTVFILSRPSSSV